MVAGKELLKVAIEGDEEMSLEGMKVGIRISEGWAAVSRLTPGTEPFSLRPEVASRIQLSLPAIAASKFRARIAGRLRTCCESEDIEKCSNELGNVSTPLSQASSITNLF